LAGDSLWAGEPLCGDYLGNYDRISEGDVERSDCNRVSFGPRDRNGEWCWVWNSKCFSGLCYRISQSKYRVYLWYSKRHTSSNLEWSNGHRVAERFLGNSICPAHSNSGEPYRGRHCITLSDVERGNRYWVAIDGRFFKPKWPWFCEPDLFLGNSLWTGECKRGDSISPEWLWCGNTFTRSNSVHQHHCHTQPKPPTYPKWTGFTLWTYAERDGKSDSVAVAEYVDSQSYCELRISEPE
jgi:hypothetical protein